LSLLLLLYEVTFFPNTTCSAPSRALLISHFLKDISHVSQSMSSHKSVSPVTCPSEISNSSSCLKNKKLCRPRNSIVFVICCPAVLLGKAILHFSYENCFFFSSFLALPLAFPIHRWFSGLGVDQNAFWLSSCHVLLLTLLYLIWNLQLINSHLFTTHLKNKFICIKRMNTVCNWNIGANKYSLVSLQQGWAKS